MISIVAIKINAKFSLHIPIIIFTTENEQCPLSGDQKRKEISSATIFSLICQEKGFDLSVKNGKLEVRKYRPDLFHIHYTQHNIAKKYRYGILLLFWSRTLLA